MLQTIWHHFSVQFLLLFQMLHLILLAVLHLKTPTTDWWKTFNSQSGSNKRMDLKSATQRAKQSVPSEKAMKTELTSDTRLVVAFCLTYFIVWQAVGCLDRSTSWALKQCDGEHNSPTFICATTLSDGGSCPWNINNLRGKSSQAFPWIWKSFFICAIVGPWIDADVW